MCVRKFKERTRKSLCVLEKVCVKNKENAKYQLQYLLAYFSVAMISVLMSAMSICSVLGFRRNLESKSHFQYCSLLTKREGVSKQRDKSVL